MEFQNIVRTVLRLIFAAGGLILLFQGSFSKMQFEDHASLKGMCFIILSLGVGFFVYKPLICNDMFERLCEMKLCKTRFLVIAVVKLLLLGLFSMVIFFTKYPGLKLHHTGGKRSRKVYDLLGVGSFSVFALVISWERQHGGEGFGVFEFMLELTMDASMEIPAGHDDGSGPNLWYMVGAYVFCFLLLIIRSYGNSLSTEQEISNSVGRQETLLRDQNDQPLGTDLHAIDLERGSENNHGRLNNLGSYEVDGLRNRKRLQHQNDAMPSLKDSDLDTIDWLFESNSVGRQETLLRDQNDQLLGTDLDAIELERGSLSTEQEISNSVGRQETLLRGQNDQLLGTDLDASDSERGSENNLGNHEVDGLRNRRRLQDQNDQPLVMHRMDMDADMDLETFVTLRLTNLGNYEVDRLRYRRLQDQNDQPLGTDLDAIDLERGSENNRGRLTNLGNYEVDGLRNRRRSQEQNDRSGLGNRRRLQDQNDRSGFRNRRRSQDQNDRSGLRLTNLRNYEENGLRNRRRRLQDQNDRSGIGNWRRLQDQNERSGLRLTNLRNYEVDGLGNRRRLQDQNDWSVFGNRRTLQDQNDWSVFGNRRTLQDQNDAMPWLKDSDLDTFASDSDLDEFDSDFDTFDW